MSPVAIYTQSPISPARAEALNSEAGSSTSSPASVPGPPSAAPCAGIIGSIGPGGTNHSSLPAQPGAVPLLSTPVPTASACNPRYAPAGHVQPHQQAQQRQQQQHEQQPPTPTRTPDASGPAPPQPGAVPIPPAPSRRTAAVPPPPRAGETCYTPPAPTQAPRLLSNMPYPAHMRIPAPAGGSFLQKGTAAAVPAPSPPPPPPPPPPFIGANSWQQGGNDGLAHPPGYHQNAHASDFSGHQRAVHNGLVYGEGRFMDRGSSADLHEDGVWDAARKWAQTAGEKLAAAETDIWKRIKQG